MIHINSLAFYTSTLSKLKGYRHQPGLIDANNGKSPSPKKGAVRGLRREKPISAVRA